jgi:hypothetical protein
MLIPTFQELVGMFKKLCESLEARESSEAEPSLQQEVCLISLLLFMPTLRIGMSFDRPRLAGNVCSRICPCMTGAPHV